MRKRLRAIAFIALLVLIAGLVTGLRRGWWTGTARLLQRSDGGAPPAVATSHESAVPPVPNVSLQIDREHELTIYSGTPLIFRVRLSNQRAMNAAARNTANRHHVEELQAAVAKGQVSQEKVERLLGRLRLPVEVRTIQLGDESIGWDQFVHLTLQGPEGKRQTLPWPLKLVTPPGSKTLTLDARNTAQLDYLLDPAMAAQMVASDYQILAILEVPADAKVASDRWRGRAESSPVKLSVVQKPARIAPAEEEKTDLQFAHYYQAAKDWTHALESAQKTLAANPKSIPAHILVGEVKETQGDLRGALEAYQTAEREFYQQYPKSYEAPLYLIHKSAELLAKLKDAP